MQGLVGFIPEVVFPLGFLGEVCGPLAPGTGLQPALLHPGLVGSSLGVLSRRADRIPALHGPAGRLLGPGGEGATWPPMQQILDFETHFILRAAGGGVSQAQVQPMQRPGLRQESPASWCHSCPSGPRGGWWQGEWFERVVMEIGSLCRAPSGTVFPL